MEQDFNTLMQKYKEELMRYDAMQRAAGAAGAQPGTAGGGFGEPAVYAAAPGAAPERGGDYKRPPQSSEAVRANESVRGEARVYPTRLQPFGQPEADDPSLSRQAPSFGFQNIAAPGANNAAQSGDSNLYTDTGKLVVHATAVGQTTPIEGADVVVAQIRGSQPYLIWYDKTDGSGNTPPFELPAPPREMSESPGGALPYSTYDVRVTSPGFYALENLNAQVFGGQTSVIEANMTPLPESEVNSDETILIDTPPNGLVNS